MYCDCPQFAVEINRKLDAEVKQVSVTDPDTRKANEHLMEAMAARMKAQPWKFKLRKTLAEHPFGTIKRWFGYTHFLLKGLEKVRCEWSLTTLAYNLKRVLNLVGFEKLMAAVAYKKPGGNACPRKKWPVPSYNQGNSPYCR